MELPNGKEMFETMETNTSFSERSAGKIFYQLASIHYYFHSRNLIHGFLRPEIFYLEYEPKNKGISNKASDNDGNFTLMMTEFGELNNFSNSFYNELKRSEQIYKPYYTSPEVLMKKDFNEKIDVFSAGVILFTMLSGKSPFTGNENNDIKQKICENEWEFVGDEWKNVSDNVKDLINKMLCSNPSKRISSRDILSHAWLVYSKEEESYSKNMISAVNQNLINFHLKDQLQQAAMAYIVNQISNSNQVKELKKLFREFDKNGDGVLSYHEFRIGYTTMYGRGMQGMELENIIYSIDKDKSGKIEYEEFLTATLNNANMINDDFLKSAFNKFDRDSSGKLSVDELIYLLGDDMDLIVKLLAKVDTNKDGEVSYDEFKKLMSLVVEEKEKSKEQLKNEESMKGVSKKTIKNSPKKSMKSHKK